MVPLEGHFEMTTTLNMHVVLALETKIETEIAIEALSYVSLPFAVTACSAGLYPLLCYTFVYTAVNNKLYLSVHHRVCLLASR